MHVHDQPPPDDDLAWQQIADALNGALSPEDLRAFDARRRGDPAFDRLVRDAEQVWTALAAGDRPALHVRPFRLPPQPVGSVRRRQMSWELPTARRRRRAMTLAVVVTVASVGVVASRLPRTTRGTDDLPNASIARASGPPVTVPIRHTASSGSPLSIVLPDGSRAQLAGGSRLYVQMPPNAGQERRVQLEGTAYFSVARDASRPFIVRAGDAVIRVTGTRFVVVTPTSRPATVGDAAAVVRVVEGGVRVAHRARGDEALLGARQEARIDARGARVRAVLGDTLAWLAFTRGEFDADDEPLAALLARLRDERGVELALGPGVDATQRLTVQFTTESATSVREQLAAITGTVLSAERGRWYLHTDASR